MAKHVEVRMIDLEPVARLFAAVHGVLYQRLMGGVTIEAWNELLAAHDDLCPEDPDE